MKLNTVDSKHPNAYEDSHNGETDQPQLGHRPAPCR